MRGWSYLDSFYYSAVVAATVGLGDFTPETPAGKLVTVFYMFCGIGLLVALLTRFADALIQSERENQERLHGHLKHAREKMAHRGANDPQPELADSSAADEEPLPEPPRVESHPDS